MIENLKLGPLDGYSALVVIIALALTLVALVVVLVVSIAKSVKEKGDEKEDKAENEFYAEYGITGEELRLNQKITRMRNALKNGKFNADDAPVAPKAVEEPASIIEEPTVQEEPVEETAPVEESAPAVEEPAPIAEEPAPVEEPTSQEEVKPEPVAEEPAPVQEETNPIEMPAPVSTFDRPIVEEPAPVEEEPKKQGVAKPNAKKVVKKKADDWSKYDGTYEGYYYDPEDACYYEGTPSPALAKKLAAKEAELEALNANKDKKVVIKKVAPPFAALKTPKNARKAPAKVDGFDESVIYGKYVIEHVDKGDGTQEYFYTLYDASGNNIYESSNYTTKEYCERAINRFKSHAIIGTYTIEAGDGKFFFVLKRKTYVHKGSPQNTFEEANSHMKEIKKFAQTDIIREQ